MNAKQQQAIEDFKKEAFRRHCNGKPDTHEFKCIEVKELEGGIVSLIVEIGRKGDEGTAASLFARDRYHVFIWDRGGLRALTKTGKWVKGWRKVWSTRA